MPKFITTILRDVHRLESTVPRKLALVIYVMKGQPTDVPNAVQDTYTACYASA